MGTDYQAGIKRIYRSLAEPKRLKTVIFFVTSACNAKCRTCFYWQELNHQGDLSWDELQNLSRTMPRFTDLWLSGGEPMLRNQLTEIVHLFYVNNGIRWVNLPTNGLLPERTAEWIERILVENPELRLDLNVAMDGLHEMQDSLRAVPGNFNRTLETLSAVQGCRRRFARLRVNVNTVICSENFDHIPDIAEFVKTHCEVDGHYFNIIRGNAKDSALKSIPTERLPALYRHIQGIYHHYAPNILKRLEGIERIAGEAYSRYDGVPQQGAARKYRLTSSLAHAVHGRRNHFGNRLQWRRARLRTSRQAGQSPRLRLRFPRVLACPDAPG